MFDYQPIVDNLRSCLEFTGPDRLAPLAVAAAEYASACAEVNVRLRQCAALLHRGLRSEALQQCETEPNLLDAVATLEFDASDEWLSILDSRGLPRPPALLNDIVVELRDAYACERPLQALLSRHRLLALGRCPLSMRIDTMRQLAELDPENRVWRQDLALFERERQREIQDESSAAAQTGDHQRLVALEDELRSGRWQEAPPTSLLEWVAQSRTIVGRQHARDDLAELGDRLRAAHAAFEVSEGRRLRARWQAAASIARLPEGDPMLRSVAPALEWLEGQDGMDRAAADFQKAVAALDQALHRWASAATLKRLHRAATSYGLELPAALSVRFARRMARLDRLRVWKVRGVLAAGLVAVSLSALGIHATVRRQQAATEAEQAAADVTRLFEQRPIRLVEAEQRLQQLQSEQPVVAKSEAVQKAASQVRSLRQQDNEALHSYEAALRQASQALADNRLAAAADALNEARAASRRRLLADPASEIQRLATAIDQAEKTGQRQRDQAYEAGLAQLVSAMRKLDEADYVDAAEKLSALQALRQKLDHLEATPGVSEAAHGAAKPLLERIRASETQTMHDSQRWSLESKVGEAIGNPEAFLAALATYDGELRESRFARAREEGPLLVSVASWNELLATWPSSRVGATPAVVRKLRDLHERCKSFAPAERVVPRLNDLEGVGRQIDAQGKSIVGSLDQLLDSPLVRKLQCLVGADGKRYYLTQPPKKDETHATFRYVVGMDLSEKGKVLRRDEILAELADAPQNRLAERLRSLRLGVSADNWEERFAQMAEEIAAAPRELDPLVRLRMLSETVRVAAQGSPLFERAYTAPLAVLKASKVNPFANWLDPLDTEARVQRTLAENEWKALPDLAASRKSLSLELQNAMQPLGPRYEWVGWLKRAATGWQCAGGPRLRKATGELYVVRPGRAGAGQPQPLGRVDAGRPHIEAEPALLVEGRPIYLVVRP